MTFYYYQRIKGSNGTSISKYIQKMQFRNPDLERLAVDLYESAIYLHDAGKININFQILKMNNTEFKAITTKDSHHSIYSSLIYMNIFMEEIISKKFSKEEKRLLIKLWFNFAYIISRHHGYLNEIDDFQDAIIAAINRVEQNKKVIDEYIDIEKLIENKTKIIYMMDKAIRNIGEDSSDLDLMFWFICKELFSNIVTCDFYATGHYMSKTEVVDFGDITNIKVFTDKYYKDALVNQMKTYSINNDKLSPINHLRSQMFIEVEQNFIDSRRESIFYLEAPTGCGKTRTSINIAVKAIENCKDISKIFYVFPFNTLVDQTAEVLGELFEPDKISVVNSIEAIKMDTTEDYDKSYLNRIMLHYPITITSHVNFFGALTGISRESNLVFSHLKNSIVILDEIQSYKNIIWKELIQLMHLASELYNIKFIIMSATLPNISKLTSYEGVPLIKNPEFYFGNRVFKNRTKAIFTLLEKKDFDLDDLFVEINNKVKIKKGRILIEFIDKVTARSFFEKLVKELNDKSYKILELTGDDPIYRRKKYIKELKEISNDGGFTLRKVIVIATQVIEAGVDIDMDIGYKDISIIDSEEQFAGRINRSCNLYEAPIYFFNIFDQKKIYKNDVRINFNLMQEESRTWFYDKQYDKYFDKVLDMLEVEKQRHNKNNIQNFYDLLSKLKYREIYKYLKLIDEESITIFIPQMIELEEELNNKTIKRTIKGIDIWNNYYEIIDDMTIPYTKKQIIISRLKKEFSYFTYNVKFRPYKYRQIVGENMYLLNMDEYIVGGKFDRRTYNESNGKGNFSPEELII